MHDAGQLGEHLIPNLLLRDEVLGLELLELAPHPVHRVPAYFFRIVHSALGEELGRINLRVGSSAHIERYAGHVGYAVDAAHRGHRYASRALRLLKPIARTLGVQPLSVTCDPGNIASRRSCAYAGAELLEIVDVPESCIIRRSGHPGKCRYLLTL